MRSRFVGVCLVGALSFAFACSRVGSDGGGPSIGSTTEAIQGGTLDSADHPFAVGVCIGNKGQCTELCSGALILPNLVVTARHCVQNTTEQILCGVSTFGGSLATNWITTSSNMFQSTKGWHSVQNVLVPSDTGVCGNDIALLVLDDVIASSEAKPVIPGVQYPMGDIDLYTHNFTAIGYGKTSETDPQVDCTNSTNPTVQATCPGYRRILQNISLACIPNDDFLDCGPLADDAGKANLTENEFIANPGVCQGDSGSSAFEQSTFNKGAPVSFGVLSRGGPDQNDTSKCGYSVYTRLDKYRDFVVQGAMQASANWTLYAKPSPDWTIFVPPADAGAPETSAPKPVTNLPDGTACKNDDECASGLLCEDTGAGLACTPTCDPSVANTCTGGYVCDPGGYCVANLKPGSTTDAASSSSGGCSTAPRGDSSSFSMVGLAAALGLMLNTRRAARRRRDA